MQRNKHKKIVMVAFEKPVLIEYSNDVKNLTLPVSIYIGWSQMKCNGVKLWS